MSSPKPDTVSDVPRRNRRKPLLIALVFAALATIVVFFAWPTHDDRRAEALAACRSKPFDESAPLLRTALDKSPNDIELLTCLAHGYFKAKNFADAEPYLSRLIELQPDSTAHLQMRLEVYRELKHPQQALADAQKLLAIDPTDETLVRTTMNLALSVGQFGEAENYCRQLLRNQPNDRSLHSVLVQILKNRGDDDGAAKILDELIKENPNDYGALLSRGILYDATGHPELAIPLLRRVYDEDRSRRRTSGYQLGMVLQKVGQQAEGERVLNEVRRLQNVELYSEAIKSQPDNAELKVRLAETLLRDGYTADGFELLQAAVKQHPNFAPAHLALASYYEKQGRSDLAAEHRKKAEKKH